MPRASKNHGKHKTSTYSQNMREIRGHKVCIVNGIDEHDHIPLKSAALDHEVFRCLNNTKNISRKTLC